MIEPRHLRAGGVLVGLVVVGLVAAAVVILSGRDPSLPEADAAGPLVGDLGHVAAHDEAETLCPALLDAPAEPVTWRYTLTAAETAWQIRPGLNVTVWAWNGAIPGPVVCAREGDKVEVTVHNRLPSIVSFHAHGLDFAPESDGTFHTGSFAPPNGSYTYRFEAGPDSVGTWAYHDSVGNMGEEEDEEEGEWDEESEEEGGGEEDEGDDESGIPESGEGIERGLYGAIIVYGKAEARADHEVFLALADIGAEVTDPANHTEEDEEEEGLDDGDEPPPLEVFNGRVWPHTPTIRAVTGETIRFRLVNAGPNDPHDFIVTGHTLTNAYTGAVIDGNRVAVGETPSVVLGALSFGDYTITAGVPGEYEYVCILDDHASRGMRGAFVVLPAA